MRFTPPAPLTLCTPVFLALADPCMMAAPSSLVATRARFAAKTLFVTPYAEDQRYPSGEEHKYIVIIASKSSETWSLSVSLHANMCEDGKKAGSSHILSLLPRISRFASYMQLILVLLVVCLP